MDRRELEIMLNEAFDRGIVSVGHLVHETVEVGFLNELGRTVGFTLNEAERHRREAECLFEYRFSCSPYSAMAYEAFHPELCERRVSKRRKQELVVYRLPDGSEPSGYAEMSVPADYADSSHVVPSVFISGTGGDRAWRDIDFDEAERKFAAAARRAAAFREGRPKLMQDEARRAAIRETRHRVCTAPILKSIKEIHR